MAGIYIKGMEMPKSCFYCPFREKVNVNPNDYVCMAMNKEVKENFALILGMRHKDCPLIEVPDHGDLIDRDAMAKDLAYDVEMDAKALDNTDIVGIERTHLQFDKDCKQNCMYYLTEQEAVIPAERSEE